MAENERLAALRKKKDMIEKRLSLLEAKEKEKERKEETRLKVLIGGGIIADAKIHAEVLPLILEILDRATPAKRDRDFLEAKGWLVKQK